MKLGVHLIIRLVFLETWQDLKWDEAQVSTFGGKALYLLLGVKPKSCHLLFEKGKDKGVCGSQLSSGLV